MITQVRLGDTTAANRRFYFHLTDAAGVAVTGQSGTPSISKDGAAFTTTGMGAATEISNGWYYADLDDADTAGFYVARWKPGTTTERASVAINAIIVGGAILEGLARLTNEWVFEMDQRRVKVYDAAGVAGGNVIMTITMGDGPDPLSIQGTIT